MFAPDGPTFFELLHQALVSTRAGYDLLAPKFDATPFRTPDEILQPAIAALGPIDSALDVCCGTGAAMRFLAAHAKQHVVGIDFSPGMLRTAREKLAHVTGSVHCEFIEGDVLTMDFREHFDLAVCFGALGHILERDQRTFLRRIHAALKPGGRFAFVTAPHPKFWSRASLVYRLFNGVMHVRNALLRPPFTMYYLTFLLPEVTGLLEEEGFSVTVRDDLFAAEFKRACLVIAARRK